MERGRQAGAVGLRHEGVNHVVARVENRVRTGGAQLVVGRLHDRAGEHVLAEAHREIRRHIADSAGLGRQRHRGDEWRFGVGQGGIDQVFRVQPARAGIREHTEEVGTGVAGGDVMDELQLPFPAGRHLGAIGLEQLHLGGQRTALRQAQVERDDRAFTEVAQRPEIAAAVTAVGITRRSARQRAGAEGKLDAVGLADGVIALAFNRHRRVKGGDTEAVLARVAIVVRHAQVVGAGHQQIQLAGLTAAVVVGAESGDVAAFDIVQVVIES